MINSTTKYKFKVIEDLIFKADNFRQHEIMLLLILIYVSVCVFSYMVVMGGAHGPPKERDNEDIAMGRKVKLNYIIFYIKHFLPFQSILFLLSK